MRTRIKSSYIGETLAITLSFRDRLHGSYLLLTIQPSLAAIRTIGLTPHPAIAATASCIAASSQQIINVIFLDQLHWSLFHSVIISSPSMFPCSVSTVTQSNPHLAIVLAWLLPGNICHAPNVRPEPVRRAFWRRLAACMFEGWVLGGVDYRLRKVRWMRIGES